jgi:outer membrane biosynthesis protein TonB
MHDMPYRVLPWSNHGEDERRFHRILFTAVFLSVAFGGIVPYFRQPVEETKGVVVPERIAKLIKKKHEVEKQEQERLEQIAKKKEEAAEKASEKIADKSAEKKIEKIAETVPEKVAETVPEKVAETVPEKVAEATAQSPRSSAESKGVLAFKNDLASLLEETSSPRMGADSKISVSANRATGDILQRSIIVSQTTGGSGGINTAAINRQSDGGSNKRIAETEVKFTHVESAASALSSGSDRPLSKGGGASRTDEEIQIVFDQYKSALYRIYNRELRINPTLRGKMVLRIVIEPDGRVSSCTVKLTDIASPDLAAGIVERVLKFNFGRKEGVPVITILYPIDFLPAS